MKKRSSLLTVLFSLALAAALFTGLYHAGLARFNYPDSERYPLRGLDVSHHQGEIDWPAIPRETYDFVYIKATEGTDWQDPRFTANWSGAIEAGMKTGAYHFFSLCTPGAQQAANFIGMVPNDPRALPPAIDIEYRGNCTRRPPGPALMTELNVFVEAIVAHYGTRPVIYTTHDFFRDYLRGSDYASYPLWISSIAGKPRRDVAPDWHIWQFAHNMRVPGIAGPVDANIMSTADSAAGF
jgi:lysozyme